MKLIASYCDDCQRVGLSRQTPFVQVDEDGVPIGLQAESKSERAVRCPYCSSEIGDDSRGAWNEVEVPEPPVEARPRGYSRDVFHRLSRLASRVDTLESARNQPPFQRVVNHEPEYARRIASLEGQIKEFRELLGVNVVNAVSVRLKEEKRLEERIEKVHADADKWTGNLHDVCVQLEERIKKVETEGVGYKAVVTRDPELQNQFSKLEKKIEPLQGWMDGVAEKIRGLNTKIDVSVMRIDALAEDHEEGVKQIRDINTRVRGLETSSVHNESPLNRITRLENGRKVLMDRVEGLKETFDGAYTNAMSKVEELEWAFEKFKKLEGWKADARVNMLEGEVGGAAATDHVDAVAQEIRKLNQRVEDLAKTPDLETELRTKLSQHVKQSDSGYEELDLRVSKLEERRPLFDEHVERCHDFEVDIRDRLTDVEARAIRIGAIEEAHGALAGQFERLVAKLDQYPEITMEASAKAREVTSRVSKLETMVAEHLLARVDGDNHVEGRMYERTQTLWRKVEETEKQLTGRIDGIELRVATAETVAAFHRKYLDQVEALAKRADEEEFAQGAVEGFTARFEEVDQQIKQLQETRASARQVSNLADRLIALENGRQ